MTVHTGAGMWVVPSHQAIWLPARLRHSIDVAGGAALRMIYVNASSGRRHPTDCRAVEVSPLLRELLRHALQLGTLDRATKEQRHLMDVLLDQLAVLPVAPIDLPMPRDPRAVRAAARVRDTPDARHTLASVARHAGASARTLERLFRTETALSFGVWRQRARMLIALQTLAEGASVTAAAIAVGYESTSAFVAAFRRTLGTTPGRYFKHTASDMEEGKRAV